MNVFAIVMILLVALAASALSSLFVYGLLWGVIWFVTSQFLASPYPLYVTASLSIIAFVSATVSVIRNNTPTLHDLRWDSGTVEDAPSRISIPGEGGRLWNVNPLGGNSISSVGQICAAALCFPPGIFVTLLRWVMHQTKNEN